MIYEMRFYKNKDMWDREVDIYTMVWENDDENPVYNNAINGKLVSCINYPETTFAVPEGVETIGTCVFAKPDWDCFDSAVEKIIIPSSVKKIEEGAFEWTYIDDIVFESDSQFFEVRANGLYTKDTKTLLWVLKTNDENEYEIPNDVKRIGFGSFPSEITLVVPSSIEEIAYDEEYSYHFDDVTIKAPADSYAIKFAKKHEIDFIEV